MAISAPLVLKIVNHQLWLVAYYRITYGKRKQEYSATKGRS